MKMKASTLEFILEACRNTYPNEFLALLRAEDGVIFEILLIPGTEFKHTSSTLKMHMVPLDSSIVGSVHSHPGRAIPSKADLNFFRKHGKIHLIVGKPFVPETTRVFDSSGKAISLEIIK